MPRARLAGRRSFHDGTLISSGLRNARNNLTGDTALEAPDDLLLGFSVALALPDVISGPLIMRHPGHRDLVKRPVGAPVAPSVQAMALRFARARQQRGDAA